MALTLELETLFLEVLNTSYIYPITSKVHFVKRLANSILTYVSNMIHICPNNLCQLEICKAAAIMGKFGICG